MNPASLLIEIGCEDLPARDVQPLADALCSALCEALDRAGVPRAAATSFATPRRIAVQVAAVSGVQPDQPIQRKGPALDRAFDAEGAPTKAAQGFARSCGIAPEALIQRDGYVWYEGVAGGRPLAEVLNEAVPEIVARLDQAVPRRMRWSSTDVVFARPVRWLLALHGGNVLPLTAFGLQAGNCTYGHRFHAPEAIALPHADGYAEALHAAFVQADSAARRETIRHQVEAVASEFGGTARITDALLDEVTALVEWPVAVAGRIAQDFMVLPPEVIVTTVETNQRYFTVFDAEGRLQPAFITVANIASKDPAQLIAGNERVVRPRLADALFFWNQDRRQPLDAFLPKLEKVTFQKQLGSVAHKAERVTTLARALAEALDADVVTTQRAAALCKADLATQMVFEFTELQGLMGGYYARESGETAAVAEAIASHYAPAGAGAPIPDTVPGRLVALADKLDTLAGIFAIGQPPTASKDPFALRRAAIGVLRIVIEGDLALDLHAWLRRALEAQPVDSDGDAALEQLWHFVSERLRGILAERGIGREIFDAVAALGIRDVHDFTARAQAVSAFLTMPEAPQLAAAHKRARNVLRQAGGGEGAALDPDAFSDASEKALASSLAAQTAIQEAHLQQAAYTDALRALAALQAPVDAFFDAVMVMDEDPAVRANRLALLAQLDAACRRVADVSLLSG
ncbi:glycine--tRNA ligase subunit beta [Algiphilus sp.]|uniref:glycine--tRNA ligase subunit beta n=1 Tax=Algiphilus sp. TaxID=1872431 RepID=UPI003BAC4BF0